MAKRRLERRPLVLTPRIFHCRRLYAGCQWRSALARRWDQEVLAGGGPWQASRYSVRVDTREEMPSIRCNGSAAARFELFAAKYTLHTTYALSIGANDRLRLGAAVCPAQAHQIYTVACIATPGSATCGGGERNRHRALSAACMLSLLSLRGRSTTRRSEPVPAACVFCRSSCTAWCFGSPSSPASPT